MSANMSSVGGLELSAVELERIVKAVVAVMKVVEPQGVAGSEQGVASVAESTGDAELTRRRAGSEEDWVASSGSESGAEPEVGPLTLPSGHVVGRPSPVVFGTRESEGGGSFYGQYARGTAVKALVNYLRDHGVRVPGKAWPDLALVCYTTGTVPPAFVKGAQKIRMFAAVGDAVLTLLLAEGGLWRGLTVGEFQDTRSATTNAANLSKVCVESGLGRYVMMPSGTNPATGRMGAEVLEAVLGVLYTMRGGGLMLAREFLEMLRLL